MAAVHSTAAGREVWLHEVEVTGGPAAGHGGSRSEHPDATAAAADACGVNAASVHLTDGVCVPAVVRDTLAACVVGLAGRSDGCVVA